MGSLRLLLLFLLLPWETTRSQESLDAKDYVFALKKATDVMLNDVTSPVAASRYYAYLSLASYEVISRYDSVQFPSMSGIVNKFSGIYLDPSQLKDTDKNLASVLTIFKAAEKLLPSGYLMRKEIDSLQLLWSKTASSKQLYENTNNMVVGAVAQMVSFARSDGFTRLNNMPRYTPKTGDAFWQPTPPAFMSAIEPHWNKLRPFFMDSAQQFVPARPVKYSKVKSSAYYKLLKEVYEVGNNRTKEQAIIASFWDCNPFAVQQIGHVEFGLKKISPGGHWIGITGIACLKSGLPLFQTAMVHALVAITLADSFIACWDEKYRSNRIRPETVIHRLIDPRWKPLLQTPPFPEYLSGHSVCSNAAASMLTTIFGDGFSFLDHTEVEFGLPTRQFSSFNLAAEEAAISRLYGGIHFRDAIELGKWQGRKVGSLAVKKFQKQLSLLKTAN
jgi:hypothetical protein